MSKNAQNILTGQFEVPLSTPVRVQMTFFSLKSKYIHIKELSESYKSLTQIVFA